MSTVLVTGAGGFVGSAVVRRLAIEGPRFEDGSPVERVVALLRPGGAAERLETLEGSSSISIERADVTDRDALLGTMERVRPRVIVHAALTREVYVREDEQLVRRPLELLVEGLRSTEGGRILLVSSAWILAAGDRLDESAAIDPVNPYGRNKAYEERLLVELAGRARLRWMTLRLFNLFGRYESSTRLIPTLVANLSRGEPVELTAGHQIRDFNDVDVAAGAFVDALAAPDGAYDGVYHIGSGRGTSVRELALRVAALVGGNTPIRFGASETQDEDVPVLVSDPSQATTTLGWKPDRDLDARLREAVDWWQARLAPPTARGVPA